MSAVIKRTTLVVRSVERSKAFYRDVLGFTNTFDQEITMAGSGYPAAEAGDRVRLAMMQGSDPGGSMVGLLEHLDPKLPEPAERSVGIGDTVIVMHTADLDRVHRACSAAAVRVFSASRPVHGSASRNGKPVHKAPMTEFDSHTGSLEINQRPG